MCGNGFWFHLWSKWKDIGTSEIMRYLEGTDQKFRAGEAVYQERECERCGLKQTTKRRRD